MSDSKKAKYAQAFYVKIKHPESGEEIERVFFGDALMDPEEFEKHGSENINDFLLEAKFGIPFDPDSKEVQSEIVNAVREQSKA